MIVAYESMFGATREVAEAISAGASASGVAAECHDIRRLTPTDLAPLQLLVVGAPTHARGLPEPDTRAEAELWLENRMHGHRLEPGALRPGVREWLAVTPLSGLPVAAFTTHADLPQLLVGSALGSLRRGLRRAGAHLVASGLECRVDEHGGLLPGEEDRARVWGREVARRRERRRDG